jgi:hypothetical protein
VFEDPPGPREPIHFTSGDDTTGSETAKEDKGEGEDTATAESEENVVDIDDLSPKEIAIQPFEDFEASFGLKEELRDNVDSLKDLKLINVTAPDLQEESAAKLASVQKEEKRIEPVYLSAIMLGTGFVVVATIFYVLHWKMAATKY